MGAPVRTARIRSGRGHRRAGTPAPIRATPLPYGKPPGDRNDQNAKAAPAAFRQKNILAALSVNAKDAFLSRCDQQRFKRGENLYIQGGRHKATYLLTSGLVRCYHASAKGKELTIGYWSAGDIIGGPYFFDDTGTHIWSARAVEHTEVFAISGRDLRDLTLEVREIGDVILDVISFKLLWDSLLMQVLGTRSVSSRLADLLLKLAALHGETTSEGVAICRSFSQDDLASMVGATRQWINSKIVDLEHRGLLVTRDNKLIVRDVARLGELVD